MTRKQDAKNVLNSLGMPTRQQSDICCLSLLALLNLSPSTSWSVATNEWRRIHDLLVFLRANYRGAKYAENSRETFRKEAMHHFRTAALIEDNGVATNSPNYRYRVTAEALSLFQSYGGPLWEMKLAAFRAAHKSLKEVYESKKRVCKVPVRVDGVDYAFSTGGHNQLQKAVVEEFAPRFAPGSKCLYLGDTVNRDLIKDVDGLRSLGFEITLHDKMPDVVLYRADRKWIYFIECVTTVGPMSAARLLEIKQMTSAATAGKVFITAFLDLKTYKKFCDQIAWETDVWIAENPDHMIHLNGDRFMGPHTTAT